MILLQRSTILTVILAVTGLVQAQLSILIMNVPRDESVLDAGQYEETAKKLCITELRMGHYSKKYSSPIVNFWSYDRVKRKLYCVLSNYASIGRKHLFRQSASGTTLLRPVPEGSFSEDPNLELGSIRFDVRLPLSARGEQQLANIEHNQESGENHFSIVIRDRSGAPWGYPDLLMEVLRNLDLFVRWRVMNTMKVEAIRWSSLNAAKFFGVYLDAYYPIDRTSSSGTCEEFLHTLQQNISANLLCRTAGEEESVVESNRAVVKLELVYKQQQQQWQLPEDLHPSLYMEFASRLKPPNGQCLYPIQMKPDLSFYEPIKAFKPYVGYTFQVFLNRMFPGEVGTTVGCDAIKGETTIEIAECFVINQAFPGRAIIVTGVPNDTVLNVMSQLMKQLNSKDPDSCIANVALYLIPKNLPSQKH